MITSIEVGLLRNRGFLIVFASQFFSLLADQFYLISLPWLLLQMSHSPLLTGSAFAVAALPRALFLPIGGVLADRIGPRNVMLVVTLLRGLLLIVLVILLAQGYVFSIFPVAFFLGTAAAFYYPAERSLLPQILSAGTLQSANGWVQGANQIIGIVGPALAGVVIGTVGGSIAIAAGAIMYFFSSSFLVFVSTKKEKEASERRSFFYELRYGFQIAWQDSVIRSLILTIACINLGFSGPFTVGIPLYVQTILGLKATAFGSIVAAFSLGAFIGIASSAMLSHVRVKGLLALCALAISGISIGELAFVSSYLSTLIALFIVGVGSGIANIVLFTLLQLRTPKDAMWRVMSLVLLGSFGLTPLSQTLSGIVAQYGGIRVLFFAGAVLILLPLLIGIRQFSRF